VPDLRFHDRLLVSTAAGTAPPGGDGKSPMSETLLLAWSSGKDSALALQETLGSGGREITLLSTVTEGYGRISMHGVREQLLRAQAESLALPLDIVYIPRECSDQEYQRCMEGALRVHVERGCRSVVFGDIFLSGIREYREKNLAKVGMEARFPLWGRSPKELSRSFLEAGFQAVITCIDSRVLDRSCAGRLYDRSFVNELPDGVDPCGENGEFHTFVFNGPIFGAGIGFARGEVVLRNERFYFCDLIPNAQEPKASTSARE